MFNNNRKSSPAAAAATSLVAKGTVVRGDVHFAGALHLEGRVEGAVLAEPGSGALFTLSEQGSVVGRIDVPNAMINGEVHGDIHVGERLELAAAARVEGDVHYRVLEMAAGARVNGKMMHQPEALKQLPRPEDAPSLAAAEA
ncbi:MAG: polymer-forming cytoskeletal protein [Mizugakiibacter sp.]|uniref:bactofilin family protein n=1 Tax=Mizugakiibacter sp. TaxID=1972610 RepID=UPI0031C2D6B5|nr:polymer-forming cytoskeletal protein [Xanthomonadaceae bacterium]